MIVPNGLGLLFAIIQILVWFYSKKKAEKEGILPEKELKEDKQWKEEILEGKEQP